jgi:2-polyprenyl-3-methyl-5-hydroxy-6-metoxy-1,4-benzoquinol methylase
VTSDAEVHDRVRAIHDRVREYYTAYYRDTLAIDEWRTLVELRLQEERGERGRVARLQALVGSELLRGRVLNVGCGTGGFDVAAAETGARVVGIDEGERALMICALKARNLDPAGRRGVAYVRAASEQLPFRDGAFDLVHCFSTIEHVRSVEETIREMVRVVRPGGAVYVNTPNAWSWWEGHYKVFWVPFLPRLAGKAYLRWVHRRPTRYLDTLRRLTPRRLAHALAAAGAGSLEFHDDAKPRELRGPLAAPLRLYYRLTGVTPFIEVVAWKR